MVRSVVDVIQPQGPQVISVLVFHWLTRLRDDDVTCRLKTMQGNRAVWLGVGWFNCLKNRTSAVFLDDLSPSLLEQQKREQILVGLERFIRKEYNGEHIVSKPQPLPLKSTVYIY